MNILRKCLGFVRPVPLLLGFAGLPAMADTFTCYNGDAIVANANMDAGVVDAGLGGAQIFYNSSSTPHYTTVNGSGGGSLGGTSASEPSALPGVIYVRGGNSELWEVTTGGVWTSLGGQITWNPYAIDVGTSTMVFYRGTNQEIWYREKTGGVWGPHTSIGGVATSSPVAVSWGNGHVVVFKRGQSNDLWYRERIGGAWGAWTGLGGSFTVDPVAITRGYGLIDVFVRSSSGNNVMWIPYNGIWSGWVNIDQPPNGAISEPAAARLMNGGLAVFVRGGTVPSGGGGVRPIYKRLSLDGGATWTGWELLMYQHGSSGSNPEAMSYGSGYLVAASTGLAKMNYCTGTGF